ncbi:ATP-dependent nuclease [Paenibacillus wenxiniae]|uniref:ATP-dependent endonuclease n=1 Tax=Paenibacillus wenxiniae TaxID=1636843 RepID=A0ABW4RN55_9BACL
MVTEQEQELKTLIATIENIKSNLNLFDTFITKIAFPYYKHFTFNSYINFKFPLTILVGKNGSGKTSAIHALYGSPKNKSISDYWFSSKLDPIEDFREDIQERPCFFYEYYSKEKNKLDSNYNAVLYHRIKHKNSKVSDYWETARPKKKYQMNTKERFSPVDKNLVYIDFRKELSAFDKFFYFGNVDNLRSAGVQDYLRTQSKKLKNVIDSGNIVNLKSKTGTDNPQNKKVVTLSKEEVEAISDIFQEEYNEIKIIKHKFFHDWGTSVILQRKGFTYSEAHAGSGEIAIVILVHKILNAAPNSLILLDEPEVSLHPGAQKRLLIFLLKQIVRYKHQIVLSTHSPVFAEDMPKDAIKRFSRNPDTHRIDILDECFPSEAFKFLGLSSKYDNAKIHVEDGLAARILEKVIKVSSDRFDAFEVFFQPGGATYLKQNYILHYSKQMENKIFVVLDGDQKLGDIIDYDTIPPSNLTKNYLQKEIDNFTGTTISFAKDGGAGHSRDDQVLVAQKQYIDYYKNHVYFLPKQTPEEIIWDDEIILKWIDNNDVLQEISQKNTFKDKIFCAAKAIFDDTEKDTITAMENMLIKNWIQKNDDSQREIKNILLELMDAINN